MCKLVENITFFKKYSEDNYEVIKSCCKFMTLEVVENQNPVMVIDGEGDKFYLILQGRVSIYIRKQLVVEESPSRTKMIEKRLQRQNSFEIIESPTKGLDKVAELYSGQSFGELALQTAGGSRTATIMCEEDCYFGVLSKKDFNLILKNQERINDIKNMGTFTSNPLVEGFQIFDFIALKFPERLYVYKNSDMKKYSHQQIVFSENQRPSHVYIVKFGEFLLSKLYEKPLGEEEQDLQLANIIRKQRNIKQQMKLKIVGQDEIIGLDQIYNEFHTYQVSCNSQHGELLRIEKSLYQTKIVGNLHAKRFAENLANSKSQQNNLRIEFVSNHYQTFASQLMIQRLKQQNENLPEQLTMHVTLKKKFNPLSLSSIQNSNLKEIPLLISNPVMRLQKLITPAQKHHQVRKDLNRSKEQSRSKDILYTAQAQRSHLGTKQRSERDISVSSCQQTRDIFHFRSPSNVFDRILQKRPQLSQQSEMTLMIQSSKQFVQKTKCLPFLTVSNLFAKKF